MTSVSVMVVASIIIWVGGILRGCKGQGDGLGRLVLV